MPRHPARKPRRANAGRTWKEPVLDALESLISLLLAAKGDSPIFAASCQVDIPALSEGCAENNQKTDPQDQDDDRQPEMDVGQDGGDSREFQSASLQKTVVAAKTTNKRRYGNNENAIFLLSFPMIPSGRGRRNQGGAKPTNFGVVLGFETAHRRPRHGTSAAGPMVWRHKSTRQCPLRQHACSDGMNLATP